MPNATVFDPPKPATVVYDIVNFNTTDAFNHGLFNEPDTATDVGKFDPPKPVN